MLVDSNGILHGSSWMFNGLWIFHGSSWISMDNDGISWYWMVIQDADSMVILNIYDHIWWFCQTLGWFLTKIWAEKSGKSPTWNIDGWLEEPPEAWLEMVVAGQSPWCSIAVPILYTAYMCVCIYIYTRIWYVDSWWLVFSKAFNSNWILLIPTIRPRFSEFCSNSPSRDVCSPPVLPGEEDWAPRGQTLWNTTSGRCGTICWPIRLAMDCRVLKTMGFSKL